MVVGPKYFQVYNRNRPKGAAHDRQLTGCTIHSYYQNRLEKSFSSAENPKEYLKVIARNNLVDSRAKMKHSNASSLSLSAKGLIVHHMLSRPWRILKIGIRPQKLLAATSQLYVSLNRTRQLQVDGRCREKSTQSRVTRTNSSREVMPPFTKRSPSSRIRVMPLATAAARMSASDAWW